MSGTLPPLAVTPYTCLTAILKELNRASWVSGRRYLQVCCFLKGAAQLLAQDLNSQGSRPQLHIAVQAGNTTGVATAAVACMATVVDKRPKGRSETAGVTTQGKTRLWPQEDSMHGLLWRISMAMDLEVHLQIHPRQPTPSNEPHCMHMVAN